MKLLLLPGDGIGPEVIAEARAVLEALALPGLEVAEAPFGGAAIDSDGVPLPEATKAAALSADAVLMGAVGGPQWASQPYDLRPEAGLLALRHAMGVFANLRPARLFPPLADASTLKPEVVEGLDILFVRELVGGVYFGEPRGIERLPSGERVGLNTQRYAEHEIVRVADVAFALARARGGHVTSVDKANVMESGLLWREVVTARQKERHPDVPLSHMLADSCAMELVRNPRRFDVILTDNLFGDLLSDLAAMLTGSLGMLPSAALGAPGAPGLYEPIHGSAPDIAGKGIANPCAAILSLAMALRHSLRRPDAADRVEAAVASALAGGARTRDLGGTLSTREMGTAIVAALAS
ncbi:3-isopropylmalate dehydrogenase [Thermaurantiacus tibetensis]|uniref:3-isopropylmalate dehydrogenase n=1 Tax=Thermaurantiacus tibetensis TaxID=2759035 RepID=UPI0018906DA3|nr:3-isopropylmalate dehydrogenase [Thermaurantiacus tibetensis]